jgi:hypothetical protein
MRWNKGLTLYQSIGLPLRMCRQGRDNDFLSVTTSYLQKNRLLLLNRSKWAFLVKLAVGKIGLCGGKIIGLSESWRCKNGGLSLKKILIVFFR